MPAGPILWSVSSSRRSLGNDGPPSARLINAVPLDHPEREAVERVCQEALSELGAEWRISLHPDGNDWMCAITRSTPNGARNRNFAIGIQRQNARSVRSMVFAVAKELKRDTDLRFGMMVTNELTDAAFADLVALVKLTGGQFHPDGWITLPMDKMWPAFIDRAEEMGVSLAASVR
jgi:hypothetical protein